MWPRLALLTLIFPIYLCTHVYADPIDTTQSKTRLPAKYLNSVGSRAQSIDQTLTAKSTQYLNRLSRLEDKIVRKLQKSDSATASRMPPPDYQQFATRLQTTTISTSSTARIYVPGLDTLSTTLKFLQTQGSALGSLTAASGPLSQASAQVQQLQGHLDETNLIQQYVTQRKQQLAQLISQYTHLPPGVTSAFANFKATQYYYRQQLEQIKTTLNDPQKIEEAAIIVLSKLPSYQQFLAKNSLLASLFQLPVGYSTGASTQGLQTRDQIKQLLQQQTGGQSGAAIQQQLQAAESQMTHIQNAISKYGTGGQDLDMPNFQQNTQKTKTFLNRLEYGANIQFAQSSYSFPTTGDIALTIGYKINDKSCIGVGASYNIGLGTGWNNMQFSSQGVGLRSFMDWKIKKTYYITGGYEMNYMSEFSKISQLRDRSAWQSSALIGLEKKYKISSKLQGNMQILYDALYKQEIPQGQMLKFRVGYNF